MRRDRCWIAVPIANLIARTSDTPRVMGDCNVSAIQDEVIDDILNSVQEQQAIEVASNLYSAWSSLYRAGACTSTAVTRNDLRHAIHRLSAPTTHTAMRGLRHAYVRFQRDQGHSVSDYPRTLDRLCWCQGNVTNSDCPYTSPAS